MFLFQHWSLLSFCLFILTVTLFLMPFAEDILIREVFIEPRNEEGDPKQTEI